MSRVDDLVALVQSANDVYLVNPTRNARMAYILVDDICELAMKSWLQMRDSNWNPISHQRDGRDYYKGFRTIIDEVRSRTPGNQDLHTLLNRFESRRQQRNHFFHDQNLSGVTVADEECVRAFCDLYDLLRMLFEDEFVASLESNQIARAQMVVIRLKRESYAAQWVYELFEQAISSKITLHPGDLGHEYHSIYQDAERIVDGIRSSLESAIDECQAEIDRINGLKKKTKGHLKTCTDLEWKSRKLREVLNVCFA